MYFLSPFSVSEFVEFLCAFIFSNGEKVRAFPQNENALYITKSMIRLRFQGDPR